MHPLTRELLAGRAPLSAVAPSLRRVGGVEDAAALLDACRGGFDDGVLQLVGLLGDRPLGERLWSMVDRGEVPLAPATEALGRLGVEASRPLLAELVLGGGDWAEAKDANFALTTLGLGRYRGRFHEALCEAEGKALFSEFLPVHAVDLPGERWVERLFGWARGASTDCNGGLFVGLARFGEAGRASVLQLVRDPWYEAEGGGTGTEWHAWAALRHLGVGLWDLYQEARNAPEAERRHLLRVLVAMLRVRAWDPPDRLPVAGPPDSFVSLGPMLSWAGPDGGLPGLVAQHAPELANDVAVLSARVEAAQQWEVLLG